MVLNFSGMIITKRLYRKSQLNVLVIHLALIVIIVGAGITRYIGYEGMMHIRNGESSSSFVSSDDYFKIQLNDDDTKKSTEEKIMLSQQASNIFNKSIRFSKMDFDVSIENYYENAVEQLRITKNGSAFISFIIGFQDGRHELTLREGETKQLHNMWFSFGDTTNQNYIQIVRNEDQLLIKYPYTWMDYVEDDSSTSIGYQGFKPIEVMSLQSFGDTQFLIKEFIESAQIDFVPTQSETHGIKMVEVKVNDETVFVEYGNSKQLTLGNIDILLYLGPKTFDLPFSIKLKEFELTRYAGSNSPSSFASEIILIDKDQNIERPYRIFMNNILSYKGFRFYQSSYDQDEQGTILSVNHDYWGTIVTYIGYFLLFASLIASFFTRKNRFQRLLFLINDTHEKRKKLLAVTLIVLASSFVTQHATAQHLIPQETIKLSPISKSHAAAFGELLVQKQEGRIVPINTMAIQLLMKIHKKSTFEGLSAEQVLLGMILDGTGWSDTPIIKINHPAIQSMIGVLGDVGSYEDFFDEQGMYILAEVVDQAFNKNPSLRNKYDKELIKVNERLTITHKILQGSMLKILPIVNDPENNWYTLPEFKMTNIQLQLPDSSLFDSYLMSLKEANLSNDYTQADKKLAEISNYQRITSSEIVPSETKTRVEIFYNRANIFKNLFPVYLTLGLFLVFVFFLQILKPKLEFRKLTNLFFGMLFIGFLFQTAGLILRWYVAGHAPWSDGYESMIYISWVTMLAGFLFMKKSPITLALTSILAGITLLTAHMSWMDPEITNLVPVLKSYWLTIHVATITASYGFLALAALMGFFNLCLMTFRNEANLQRLELALKELSFIIELSLMCGITLLVIGNFLGGIWANESWGRYWGWDPKETWTLVTIIVYSFILHMGLIPGFKNMLVTNFLTLIGFGAVLMTYFGVNYYLSGLHSYAGGDPVPVPSFVYYTLVIIGVVTAFATYNQYKLKEHIEKSQKLVI
jgi:cytochrome c-type biogenesis protein CcsB